MDFIVTALLIWYVLFPNTFGEHLGKVMAAMDKARSKQEKTDV